MLQLPHILAVDTDDGSGKIIGAVVFLIIWAIAGISSWIKKQQQQQKSQRPAPRPAQPQPAQQYRQPQRMAHSQRHAATARPAPPPLLKAPPPPPRGQRPPKLHRPVAAPPPITPPPVAAVASPGVSTTPAARPRPRVTAPTIAAWLKPKSLRHQFILTEIFQPPLAMREERL